MWFEDEFYKFALLALYCFVSWCLVYYVSLHKYHMLFEDESYEGIALLKTLHCLFSLLMIYMLHNIHFLSFFLLLSVKNDEYIFNWLSLKKRKYKIIVVPYECCTMS